MQTIPTYNPDGERILRLPEVMKRTGLSRSSIYKRIQAHTFPKQKSLGGRCTGWLESEVRVWIANVIAANQQQPP